MKKSSKWPAHWKIAIVLFAITLVAFCRVLRNQFINLDDPEFIHNNPFVRSGLTYASVAWAFKTTHTANWHPLTWISHMVDVEFFGLNSAGHHLTSLLVHAVSAVLLFLVLYKATFAIWRSAFIAALFAVHPLRIESVAWIAERKDVLSTAFLLLTILAYIRFVQSPCIKTYVPVVVFFVLGLMSKPMLVTLPFALLLLDYWPLGRTPLNRCSLIDMPTSGARRLVLEKIPLFVLSALSCIVTYLVQREEGAVRDLAQFSLGVRIANGIVAYVAYIGKMLWPAKLSVFYPHPGRSLPIWEVIMSALVLIGITFFVLRLARRAPYLPVGWFWYLGTLIPVLGLVQVGGAAMADRYTYVPLIGLSIIITWGLPELVGSTRQSDRLPTANTGNNASSLPLGCKLTSVSLFSKSDVLPFAAGLAVVALMISTAVQLGYWKNTFTLFERALAVTARNAVAHGQLAVALEAEGKLDEALEHYRQAVRVEPRDSMARYNLGVALAKIGRTDEAIEEYNEVLRLNPEHVSAHNNLGLLLLDRGNVKEAIHHFREALRIDPNFPEARNNLANALAGGGNAQEAIQKYEEALEANPNDATAHYNLGVVLAGKGETEEAIRHYLEAVRLRPNYAKAHLNLGLLLEQQGRTDEAAEHFAKALQADPRCADAHNSLGIILAKQGRLDLAKVHFDSAVRLDPNNAQAHFNLGNIFGAQGEQDKALRHFTKAVELKPDFSQAHFNLAVALFHKARYAEAWKHVRLAQKYGFEPNPAFLQALSAKMPEPNN
ncbi:MAG: tetratricopeptide repeat protein [Armatimonadota bacterium]|nr:tetratricopeptide repeat protein [Armatimonadota bacterium]